MFMNCTKLFITGAAAALVTFSGFAADAAKPAAPAAQPAAKPAAPADPFSVLPPVVAEMNGKKVSRQELVDFVKKLSPDGKIPAQLTPEMVRNGGHELVHAYISKTLLDQAIAKAKFTMTKQEIEKAVSAQFEKMPEELRKMLVTQLSAQKKTLPQYISELAANPAMREQIVIESFARKYIIKGAKATEADAKKFYEAHKNEQPLTAPADAPDTLRASHILIAIDKGSDGKAELKKAQEIYAQVKKAPGDFGKIAHEKSTCPSGKRAQGSLGAFQKGQMVPEFEKAVLALKEGEISQPVKTQFGWHIIRRDALRKAEVRPFAAVKDDLIAMLTQQKEQELFLKYMENLEKTAKVKNLVPQAAPNMMVPGAK